MMDRDFLALQARTTPEENLALPRDVRAKGMCAQAVSHAAVASLDAGLGKPQQVEDSGLRGHA